MMYICTECSGIIIDGQVHTCPPIVACTSCGLPTHQSKSGRCLACVLLGDSASRSGVRAYRWARALENEALRQEEQQRHRTPVPAAFYKAFQE